MTHSETITKIAPALLIAQKQMGAAKKDAENPYFKSSYADLGAVMQVCKEPLNSNGIIVLQPVGIDEQGGYVETILLHESGEFIADRIRVTAKSANNPQDQGSAITYARRYGLQSMLFIPAEDDDAEKATNHHAPIKHVDEDGYTHEPYEEAARPVRRQAVQVAEPIEFDHAPAQDAICEVCQMPMEEKRGTAKTGKKYHAFFCSSKDKSHTVWLNN